MVWCSRYLNTSPTLWHCTSMELPHKNQQRQTPVNEKWVYLRNQYNVTMKVCDAPEGACAGLLPGFLLLVHLHFLLMPGVVPWWIWLCFPGLHAGHVGYAPIPCLRALLRRRASWSRLLGMTAFLLASCMVWSQGALFMGECSPRTLSCDIVIGGGANPEHSLMCLFICWLDEVMALRQAPTHEICIL